MIRGESMEITLREMQQIELDMLLELDRVCKNHSLRYYLDGGTLLGAMCYEGFIPWDDDIDIKMPRPDYERLKDYSEEFSSHIQVRFPSKEDCEYTFLKLIDTRTLLVENSGGRTKRSGVYIDILPMDGHPEDGPEYGKHLKKLSRLNTLFHGSQDRFEKLRNSASPLTRMKGAAYAALYTPWRLLCKLTKTAKKYQYDECRRVGLLVEGDPIRERFEKAWLEPPTELEFEGHMLPAPSGYRRHMEIFYGEHVTKPESYHNLPQYPGNHDYTVSWRE